MAFSAILSLALCVGFPFLARWGERSKTFPAWLSSIIACYGIGIIISNLRLWSMDNDLLEAIAGGSMLIGLPLLLFSVRIKESIQYAGRMLLGFMLCCVAGLICTGIVGYLLSGSFPDAWKVTGMLVGLYTGGTPNVQAIGLALEAPSEYMVLIQAADILLGGSYLLGLVTILPPIYSYFFPPSDGAGEANDQSLTDRVSLKQQLPQLAVGLVVSAISVGSVYLITGALASELTAIILLLTTLALLVSVSPISAKIGNSYPLGEYFILVFCVALGLLADFRALAEKGIDLLYFSALALTSTTLLHLCLCKLFKIDRDTVILSYVAGFYGPVFVAQVAAALKNQRLMAAGIAVSLLGFGIGNYLGLGLAYLVRWLVWTG